MRRNGFLSAPAEQIDGFKFRGGHLSVDFTATLAGRLKDEPRELLGTPRDLSRWLVAAGLARKAVKATDPDLEDARILREAIYRSITAAIGERRPAAKDRRTLNDAAARPSARPSLLPSGDIALIGEAREFLSLLAGEAIALLGGDERDRLKQCRGGGCAILFVDSSKSGDRSWCSMSACGNRAKATAFRLRERARKGA